MTKRVLISGSSGFLGAHLAKDFANRGYTVFAVGGRNSPPAVVREVVTAYEYGDLSNSHFVSRLVGKYAPDVIIHSAACSSPALCEQDPTHAAASNLKATENIVSACVNTELSKMPIVVFFSSDMVFEGRIPKPGGFNEEDEPKAFGVYAKTKLEAESFLIKALPRAFIFRLALVYGEKIEERGGFMDWLRTRFEAKQAIPAYYDEFRTPIWTKDISFALGRFIDLLDTSPGCFATHRIFHLGGAERLSRTTFAEKVAARFNYDSSLINAVSRLTHESSNARPADLSLNSELFWSTIESKPTLLEVALESFN